MARPDAQRQRGFTTELFAPLPERYDRLEEILSFGQNARWRRAMVDHVLPARPRRVLDVATGTAGVALQLVARSEAEVVGIDLTPQMVHEGLRRIRREGGQHRVQLTVGQAERLPFPDGTFDALTFTYLLRYVADPAATLAELARVVRPGGLMASLEFLVPPRPFWRRSWWAYTRLVLPVAGGVTGGRAWYDVGRFLGPNISAHYRRYPVDWTAGAWADAGFDDVGWHEMSLGGGLVMWGRRRGR